MVAFFMSIGSYYAGDRLVLLSSGAQEVPQQNPPEQYQQLLNVVTEMSLASGLPMPKVYVINDTAPNAFATGRDPKHASVAVTSGLLEKMDREELQGVLAHELSHVGNYDIRFALLVGVLVGSIALLVGLVPALHLLGRRAARRGRPRPGRGRRCDHPVRHRAAAGGHRAAHRADGAAGSQPRRGSRWPTSRRWS